MVALMAVKRPMKPMNGFDRTTSDMEAAIRQNTTMIETLINRLGVTESLAASISQAGVLETNFDILISGRSDCASSSADKNFLSQRCPISVCQSSVTSRKYVIDSASILSTTPMSETVKPPM